MKNAIKVASLALCLVFMTAGEVRAQSRDWWFGATYQGALPGGDTKDFTEGFSWRNIGIEGRTLLKDNLSLGLYAGWNVFNDEVDGTISLGGADVSGYQSRFVNAIPLLATIHLYSSRRSGVRPYIGGGLGTYWVENRVELGLTGLESDNWHFGLAPEVGFAMPMQNNVAAYVSVKYNYAFEAGDVSHSYWTFGIGIATSDMY
jgi:opacity protein-like surface antigen